MADTKKLKSKASAAKARAAVKAKAAKEKKVVKRATSQASGFADFIRSQGIVGLAIGLAIGTVASGTVKTIVQGFVTPLVQFLVGTHKHLEVLTWHVELWGRTADFQWGAALSSLITLLATIFVVYVLVKMARLDRVDKK